MAAVRLLFLQYPAQRVFADLAAQLVISRLLTHAIDPVLRITLVDNENVSFAAEIRAFRKSVLVNVEHHNRFFPTGFERPHLIQTLKT